MSEELGLDVILSSDDIKSFEAHWERDGDGNLDRMIENPLGEDVTITFAAAHFRATKILRYLVADGGNLDFSSQGFSVRDVARQNLDCLLAMIEGGMEPNSAEIFQVFVSTKNNSVPKDGHLEVLNDFISRNGKDNLAGSDVILDFTDQKLMRKLFRKNDSFKFLLFDAFEILESVKGQRTSIAVQARKLANESIDELISLFLTMIGEAIMLTQNHGDVLFEAVANNFRGFRRNRKWLQQKFQSTADDATKLIAKRIDKFEDDEDLLNLVKVALHRFPIDEVAKAQTSEKTNKRNDGLDFEALCQQHLKRAGYATELTVKTGDQGADIVAMKDGLKFVVQCKDHEKPVGNRAVQEVNSARQFHAADYAIVCAPNGFTKSAKALAITSSVLLVKEHSLGKLETLVEILD